MRITLFLLSVAFAVMGSAPSTRAGDLKHPLLLVVNKGDHTLGLIDPIAGRQIATVDVGGITGHEVIASRDARFAYVPIYGDSGVGQPGTDGSTLAVVDLAARKVTDQVDFGHGVRPHCVLLGPKDGLLYVTTELDQAITIIDPQTLKIVSKVPTTQPESHMLVIARDGRRAYTANVGAGTISVLDLEARKTVAVIPIASRIQRIALSVDDQLAFTADQVTPQLAVVDISTQKVKTWIPLPSTGYASTPTPEGRWLLVALRTGKQIAVIDLNAMKVVHTIDVPATPQEVVISPDGTFAYVSCDASKKVAVIRTSDWSVDKLIDAGASADGLAWADTK